MAVKRESKFSKQKGFALIFVLVFIALILGIVADAVYEMQVNVRSTIDQQNILDAETSAQTGMEFARLLLNMNNLAVSYQNNPLITLPKNIYNTLNGQPIGNLKGIAGLEKMSSTPLTKAISPEIYSALKAMPGYFVLNVVSENSKLNINMLQSRNYQMTEKALLRLFSTQNSQEFLQYMGYTPQQLVDSLSSYIKISVSDGYLQAATQSLYDAISAKYQPKHAALESLQELRRIPGFNNDNIYNMYSPYFTVWPITGIPNTLNINSVPTEFIAPLLTPQNQEVLDLVWDRFDDFRKKNTFTQQSMSTWFQNNMPGLNNDPDGTSIIQNILGYTDTIFKVESRGVANGIERTLVVIFQQISGSKPVQLGPGATPQPTPTPSPSPTPPPAAAGTGAAPTPSPAPAGGAQSTTLQVIFSEWK